MALKLPHLGRTIEMKQEVKLLRQSAAVWAAAVHNLEETIRSGVSEHELLGIFHRKHSLGGEYRFTRLLATGHETKP